MNPFLQIAIAWIEAKFPGSRFYIDFALRHIDAEKVQAMLLQALHDYQSGMSFQAILKDLLTANLPAGVEMPTP